MKLPTKTVVTPDWQKVCEALEKDRPFGLYLECSPEQTRQLYMWALKHQGYRIAYRAILSKEGKHDGVFITIKDAA